MFCSILGYHDCKAKYKLAIWNAYLSYEDTISDEMCSHFLNKRIPEFWKSWSAKFRKSVSKKININGHVSYEDIANEFAETCTINFLTLVSYSTSIVIGGLWRLLLPVLM